MRVRRLLSDPAEGIRTSNLCYASAGFSLHAATRVEADDRERLEQLCRYVSRPPLSSERLERISEDKLKVKLKTPWSDGTSFLVVSPLELLEKLSVLVPPPRFHLVRYGGIFAPNAKLRAKVVPASTKDDEKDSDAEDERKQTGSSKYRLAWAALLARVFDADVSSCPACGSRMRIVAFITDPFSVRRYLEGVGLPTEAPPIFPARPPPQTEFDY
jgi:hypothetical protein